MFLDTDAREATSGLPSVFVNKDSGSLREGSYSGTERFARFSAFSCVSAIQIVTSVQSVRRVEWEPS